MAGLGRRVLAVSTAVLAGTVLAGVVLTGCGSPALLGVSDTPAGSSAHEASLDVLTDGYAVAWYDTRDGHPEIYTRRLEANGQPSGPSHRLTRGTDAAYEPDLVSDGTRLIVGWYEKTASEQVIPKLGVWNLAGELQWAAALAQAGRNTVVSVQDGTIFAAWIQDETEATSSVWASWWNTDGDPLGLPVRLAPAGRTTWNLNATLDGHGDAWLVFDADAGTRAEELFLIRASVGKMPLVQQLTPDDGFPSKYPDVAFFDDQAALTWFDERDGNQEVYVAIAPTAEIGESLEDRAQRVTDTPGNSIGAYLSWNGDRLAARG